MAIMHCFSAKLYFLRKYEKQIVVNPAKLLPNNANKFRLALLEGDRFHFNTFIVDEIFQLFARTDALILVGYESGRTKPRGLKNYTLAPTTVKPAAFSYKQGG